MMFGGCFFNLLNNRLSSNLFMVFVCFSAVFFLFLAFSEERFGGFFATFSLSSLGLCSSE